MIQISSPAPPSTTRTLSSGRPLRAEPVGAVPSPASLHCAGAEKRERTARGRPGSRKTSPRRQALPNRPAMTQWRHRHQDEKQSREDCHDEKQSRGNACLRPGPRHRARRAEPRAGRVTDASAVRRAGRRGCNRSRRGLRQAGLRGHRHRRRHRGRNPGEGARRRRHQDRGADLLRQGLYGDHARRGAQRGFRAEPSRSASAATSRPAASSRSRTSCCSRARCASSSATRPSRRSASAARPAAISTKAAPRPASTRSVTGSNRRRRSCTVRGFRRIHPGGTLNNASALPWAMRSRSAALTGICSKKARPAAIVPYG